MAEYIDLATPLEVYVERGGFYIQKITTLRELLDVNHLRYEIADVRTVVLCRDCKNNYNTCLNHGINEPMCDFTDRKLREDDFCSRGEKREES